MSPFPAHPAWDFVTRLYGEPGVAAACLDLQERHGLDVTLMLFCLWHGEPLAPKMAALMAAAREWREATVLPIRTARRWLKRQDEQAALYKIVLAAEIDCEHGELLMLAQLAESLSGPAAASPAVTSENLSAFFRESGITPGEPDRAAIATILAAAGEIAAIPPQGPVT